MSVLEVAEVTDCSVSSCSYNDHGCQAFAVTVGKDAGCATFIPLDKKGGIPRVVTQVGACQRANCTHNENLECGASQIKIGSGSGTAECLSFEAR